MKEAKRYNLLKLREEYLNSLSKMEGFKLPLLCTGNLVFIVAFFGLGAFLLYEGFTMTEYLPVGILCFVTAFIYLASLIVLKKEKLHLSALIGTIGILFACLIIIDVCPPSENPLVYYRSGCFLAVMAVCNQTIVLQKRQLRLFNICVAVIWVVMIIRTVPYTKDDLVQTISSIGINTLGNFIALLLITSSNKFNTIMLAGEIQAEQNASKNLDAITNVLAESRNGLSVGQKLVDETQKAESNITEMNSIYEGITLNANDLSGGAVAVSQSSAQVLNQAEKMQDTVSKQNTLIQETTGALMEISGNISNLSEIAEQRSSNMKEMLDTFAAEKVLINQIVNQVQQVQESSDGIAGFVKTVNTIATQTNLLAMNASIEAAHAGVVGKGFSVIAHEIRNLSVQTAKNAAQITEELNKNAEVVQATTQSVESFNEYIQKTNREMEYTIEMIEQLLTGIQSIDRENGKVMNSLKDVVEQSGETNVLAENVVSEITAQDETLRKIRGLAEQLKSNVDAMNIQLKDIQGVISVIDSEAEKNIEVSKNINSCLE